MTIYNISSSHLNQIYAMMAIEIAASMPLLQPLVALNIWTFVIEAWMYAVRLPAVKNYNVKYTPQFNKQYLYSKIPPEAQWPGGKHFFPVDLKLSF
jgi:hypothetical protein